MRPRAASELAQRAAEAAEGRAGRAAVSRVDRCTEFELIIVLRSERALFGGNERTHAHSKWHARAPHVRTRTHAPAFALRTTLACTHCTAHTCAPHTPCAPEPPRRDDALASDRGRRPRGRRFPLRFLGGARRGAAAASGGFFEKDEGAAPAGRKVHPLGRTTAWPYATAKICRRTSAAFGCDCRGGRYQE